jgi:hypothetical protein
MIAATAANERVIFSIQIVFSGERRGETRTNFTILLEVTVISPKQKFAAVQ